MPPILLRGKEIGAPIREDVKQRVTLLKKQGWQPRLASVQIGNTDAADVYIRNQRRLAERMGIEFDTIQLDGDVTHAEALATVKALNIKPTTTGIILQRPMPDQIDLEDLQGAIHATKDVEGMSPANIGKVVYGDFTIGPCTSLASVEMLRATGKNFEGLEAVVIGHSEIVGKPIALHLLKELSTVTVCHHATVDLKSHTKRADVIFVATGVKGLVTGDMVKKGVVVVDIGINPVEEIQEDGAVKTRIVGDVDFESVSKKAGWITPVPGGVGPVTLSILMRNTVTAAEIQKRRYEKLVNNN